MNINQPRRKLIEGALKLLPFPILGALNPFGFNLAAAAVDPTLIWGGLGYSRAFSRIDELFPLLKQAYADEGGMHNVVGDLIGSLNARGRGEVRDITDTYDSDEGGLVFVVGADFEQRIRHKTEENRDFDVVYNFCYFQAQVLYVQTNSTGGQEGAMLNVVYSYPFRQTPHFFIPSNPEYNGTAARKMFNDRLFHSEGGLLKTFERNIANKSFRERRIPRGIRVTSVTFSDEFNSVLDYMQIRDRFEVELIGNAMSTSLSERGGLSVLPYQTNQLIGTTLASRFKDSAKVFELASNMGGADMLDYEISVRMEKSIRKIVGENDAYVRIRRGISAIISVKSTTKGHTIFEHKIIHTSKDVTTDNETKPKEQLIEDQEALPRFAFEAELANYDLRTLYQLTIRMFDNFVHAVMTLDPGKLELVHLDIKTHGKDLQALQEVFQSCVYDGR